MKKETKNYNYIYAFFDKDNKQHNYILSLTQQLNWTKTHPKWGRVTDLEKLGGFIKEKFHKPLKKMEVTEVQKLIHALEQILVK